MNIQIFKNKSLLEKIKFQLTQELSQRSISLTPSLVTSLALKVG
jgi:hypothetical protein